MSILRKFLSLFLVSIFCLSLIVATGCTKHPNPEQISAMEEARSACLAAEQKADDAVKANEKLQAQVNAKQKELDDLKAEKEMVQKKINEMGTQE